MILEDLWRDGQTLANNMEKLQLGIEEKGFHLFFNYYSEHLPQWEDFIKLIDASHRRGDIDIRRKFFYRIPLAEEDTLSYMRPIELIAKLLTRKFVALKFTPANVYINTAVGEEDWPMHADSKDSIYVVCEGSVLFRMESGEEHVIKKGDGAFFPAGLVHQVIPLEPRVAFIITIDYPRAHS